MLGEHSKLLEIMKYVKFIIHTLNAFLVAWHEVGRSEIEDRVRRSP